MSASMIFSVQVSKVHLPIDRASRCTLDCIFGFVRILHFVWGKVMMGLITNIRFAVDFDIFQVIFWYINSTSTIQ